MKDKELLIFLNKSPNSISLHDATLCSYKLANDQITFTFCISEYQYLINNIEKYIKNKKNSTVLTLSFNGIKNLETSFSDDFLFTESEVISNNEKNNSFQLLFTDYVNQEQISFEYDSFSWDIIGEFNKHKLNKWRKEHNLT